MLKWIFPTKCKFFNVGAWFIYRRLLQASGGLVQRAMPACEGIMIPVEEGTEDAKEKLQMCLDLWALQKEQLEDDIAQVFFMPSQASSLYS